MLLVEFEDAVSSVVVGRAVARVAKRRVGRCIVVVRGFLDGGCWQMVRSSRVCGISFR